MGSWGLAAVRAPQQAGEDRNYRIAQGCPLPVETTSGAGKELPSGHQPPARPPSGAIDAQAAATTWHLQPSTTRSDELEIQIRLKKVWRYFDSLWHWCPDPKYGESPHKWASLLRVTTCTFCPFASGQNHSIVPLVKLGVKAFFVLFQLFLSAAKKALVSRQLCEEANLTCRKRSNPLQQFADHHPSCL